MPEFQIGPVDQFFSDPLTSQSELRIYFGIF